MRSLIRPGALTAVAVATSVVLVAGAGPAAAQPVPSAPDPAAAAAPGEAPTLTPRDGAYLEGTVPVAAEPTTADDSVTELVVDGDPIDATTTTGVSHLTYDVGSNSVLAHYQSYLMVNDHRIEMPGAESERVSLEVPNDELVDGTNTVTFHVGTSETSCGVNYDDYVLSNISLELLGEIADGDANDLRYTFGDGSCGSNSSKITEVELTFEVAGDPRRTTGLAADLDTTTLSNGSHELSATTQSGATTLHTVRVNNAPAGAPRLLPVDGTLTNGTQPVFGFFPAGGSGSVTGLTVDGDTLAMAETLAPGTATLAFTVGGNSIEARYFNHLLVNGRRVEIGGDWVSEQVELSIPHHFLLPGDNVIEVVTGDINGSTNGERCANRDDFTISDIALSPATGTATGVDLQPTYEMGDGYCGSNGSKLADAELRFTVDDAETTTALPTLGGGEAMLSMYIGGNGAEAKFGNVVRVNGLELEIGDVRGETVELAVPNQWLVPGTNTVEVVAGPNPDAACGDNYDDFPVSDLSLTPATGEAVPAYRQTQVDGDDQPIRIGDGSCGSSHTGTKVAAVPFVVDAPAGGVRVDLDTTTLEDGEHTLAATSAGGTATRTITTDNTAPRVTGSSPAAGQSLSDGVVFDAVIEDASGVVGEPAFTLDGEPLARGDLIGPGLAAGEHTIAVTLTDSLGNTADRAFSFTSVGIPEVPAGLKPDNHTKVKPGKVDLRATVATPGGGDVTATFSRAEIVGPTVGFTGTASSVPTTLQVDGEEGVDVDALQPLDGATVDAPASGEVTFQRYDLPVAPDDESPMLRWNGTIDPERVASLRAWDTTAREWVALASTRGTFAGPTQLTAPVAPRFLDGDVVHVLVTGEDPFADDMEPRNPGGFADPGDYDFSLAHFTDTQYLSEGAVEQETAAERAIWKKAYGDTTQWLADHAQQRRIAHVMHTGDIIQNNINPLTTPEAVELADGEFEVASDVHTTLDRAGIPSQVIAGNHDNQWGAETGPEARYNQYFGPERYASADDQWATAEYGGPWRDGDNQNNYVLFTAGGLDFVVVGLSYGVTRAEADWADGILKQYSDRNAIVLTHDYLNPSGGPDGRGSTLAGDGSVLYDQLVAPNPNVFLVLAGHRHGVGTNVKAEVGEVDHGVVELLADYQAYTVSADEVGLTEVGGYAPDEQLRFGASYLRLLQFDVDRSEMIVDTYSPFLDDFGATEHQGANRSYDGTEDDMVLPVDLTSRSTSFTTDAVSLLVPVEEVGSDTVASGEVASVSVKGLGHGSLYGWIVSAESAAGGRAVTEPAIFRTSGQADKQRDAEDREPRESEVVATLAEQGVAAGADVVLDVAVKPGRPTPTGVVEVRDGDAVVASGEPADDGTVQLTWEAPAVAGERTYEVHFLGSEEHTASSAEVTLRVNGGEVPSTS